MKLIRPEAFIKLSDEEIIERIKESPLMDSQFVATILLGVNADLGLESILLWKALGISLVPIYKGYKIECKIKIKKKVKITNLRFQIIFDSKGYRLEISREKLSGLVWIMSVFIPDLCVQRTEWPPLGNLLT